MIDSELMVLPHTLSMHGGGEVNISNNTQQDFQDSQQSDENRLEIMLSHLMLQPQKIEQWQTALAQENDGLPLPETFVITPWDEEDILTLFNSEQKRLYTVFQQLLQDERKSTKYHQAFTELCESFPETEMLWHMHFSYIARWQTLSPEVLQQKMRTCLSKHPQWLFVRLLYARQFMHEDEQGFAKNYAAAMNEKLLIHEHLSTVSDLLAYQFHLDLYMYFALSGNLHRAAFAFWQAYQVCSAPEALYPLALFIMSTCEKGPEDPKFENWARFLQNASQSELVI